MTTQSRINNTDELKELKELKILLRAEKLQLDGDKNKLKADRNEFETQKFLWQGTKKGGSATFDEAIRQLNDVKSEYEAAKSNLIAAKFVVETSGKHLKEQNVKLQNQFSQLQSEISNGQNTILGLKNDKVKLEAEASNYEAAKTQLIAAKSGLETSCKHLEEQNVKLQNQVSQLQSEISNGQDTILGLKNDKEKLEAEASKDKVEITRLATELEQVKKENILLQEKYKILERMKSGNPKVFFDMTMRGVPVGRIVFELFADNTPDKVEIFRALCTGEKGVSQTGKPLHYKGTSINYVKYNYWLSGGDIIKGNVNEAELIYGDMKPAGENLFNKYTGPGDLCMFLKEYSYKSHSFGIFPLRDNTNYVGGYVMIGKVIQGMDVVSVINEAFPNYSGMLPAETQVVIANSGQLS